MPMRFLTDQTHNIGALGYDWSPLSIGKAIDKIEIAMMEISVMDQKCWTNIYGFNI